MSWLEEATPAPWSEIRPECPIEHARIDLPRALGLLELVKHFLSAAVVVLEDNDCPRLAAEAKYILKEVEG